MRVQPTRYARPLTLDPSASHDSVFAPSTRIGQRWEATRARRWCGEALSRLNRRPGLRTSAAFFWTVALFVSVPFPLWCRFVIFALFGGTGRLDRDRLDFGAALDPGNRVAGEALEEVDPGTIFQPLSEGDSHDRDL